MASPLWADHLIGAGRCSVSIGSLELSRRKPPAVRLCHPLQLSHRPAARSLVRLISASACPLLHRVLVQRFLTCSRTRLYFSTADSNRTRKVVDTACIIVLPFYIICTLLSRLRGSRSEQAWPYSGFLATLGFPHPPQRREADSPCDLPSEPLLSPLLAALTNHPQVVENPRSLNPLFATPTSHAFAKSCVCHSCRKTRGGGGAPFLLPTEVGCSSRFRICS